MKRLTPHTQDGIYDLIIAGGGIYGASMAYTAALNGLKTVLLEKDDFVANTSANSQKVIHGGLRYLQSFDIKRVIESIREKQRFYFLFPHLVKPLPCLLPTMGWGPKGNEAFRIGIMLYKLIQRAVCKGKLTKNLDRQPRLLSKEEVHRRFPHLDRENIRGGALWYDGLCLEPERVIMGLVKGAGQQGADLANYAEVKSIRRIDGHTLSLTVFDHLVKKTVQLKTRKVALCTGSWFMNDIGPGPVPKALNELTLIRGMNVILPSLFKTNTSLALKVRKSNESRFLFIVPWKQYSIGGTYWEESGDQVGQWIEKEQAKHMFLDLIELAAPSGKRHSEILAEHVGFVPGKGAKKRPESAADRILSHDRLVDREESKQGDVLQVVGVKFTTAFGVVFKALETLFPKTAFKDVLQFDALPCGSPAADIQEELAQYGHRYQKILTFQQIELIFNLFGNELPRVVDNYLKPRQKGNDPLTEKELYIGLSLYCVEEEMTVHLQDLIYRRLFPGTPELPSHNMMNALAECMAELLMWSAEQMEQELHEVTKQR